MIRKLPLVLLASGCFSVPPYAPEEAVTFTASGTGGVVAGKLARSLPFELQFADGDGFHFPNALRINGSDVMGHDPGQTCNQEDEVGILIKPAPRVSANGQAPRVTNLLTPVLSGPAVVQLTLDWATRFACNNVRSPGGISTFTVFPDGRIVRFDTITDPSSAMIDASQCSCNSDTEGFTISTFWTLARDAFRTVQHSGEPDNVLPLPVAGAQIGANAGWSCVDDGARQVAFAWSNNIGAEIRGRDQLVRFGVEFMDYIGASMLGAFSLELGSALFIGDTGCKDAVARAQDYFAPKALTVNGVTVKPSLRDGIYGGDPRGDDGGSPMEPGIELTQDVAELAGPVVTPYAVWLRFPRAVDALRARRDGASGVWYVPQRVDDRSWIIFFKEPLQTDQKVIVEPI